MKRVWPAALFGLLLGFSLSWMGFADFGEVHRMFVFADLRLFLTFACGVTLTGLAFLCGGLVSAAGFSIGWRHQAQRNTAAETALSAATARIRGLEQRTRLLRNSLAQQRQAAKEAVASERSVLSASAAAVSNSAAASVASGAGTVTATAGRVISELKALVTYLTTTPAGQLDPGYIASQSGYLTRQLTRLQTNAGGLGGSIASFEAAIRKLSRSAATLASR